MIAVCNSNIGKKKKSNSGYGVLMSRENLGSRGPSRHPFAKQSLVRQHSISTVFSIFRKKAANPRSFAGHMAGGVKNAARQSLQIAAVRP